MTRAHLRASVSTTCATRNTVWATEFTVWATVFTVAQTVNPPLGAKKRPPGGRPSHWLVQRYNRKCRNANGPFPRLSGNNMGYRGGVSIVGERGVCGRRRPAAASTRILSPIVFAHSSRMVPSMDITKQTSTPCEGCKMAVCHDGPFLRGCANKKKPDVPMRGRVTFMYEYLFCNYFVLAGAGLLLIFSRASRPFPSLSRAFF